MRVCVLACSDETAPSLPSSLYASIVYRTILYLHTDLHTLQNLACVSNPGFALAWHAPFFVLSFSCSLFFLEVFGFLIKTHHPTPSS